MPVGRGGAWVAGLLSLFFAFSAELLAAQAPSPDGACGVGQIGVTGTVADMLSRRPLPGTSVTLEAPASFVQQIVARGTAGAGGDYTLCVDRIGEGWQVYAELDTLVSRAVPVTAGAPVDTLYVPWSEPVTLTGSVRVQGSDEPLESARISLEGRPVRALTDGEGRFTIRGIGAGPLVITTSHIGYAARVDTILAESGANIGLEITLGEQAIELDPIVVTARRPPSVRDRTAHALGMTREQVAAALPRSIDFVSMLRQANVPGLTIGADGPDGPCVEFFRSGLGGCSMVQVFVNGNLIMNPGLMVATVDPAMVEEFIVLRPAFAQFQYMGPLTENGVLDIILK
jgi:hypothetical protein